MRFLSVCLALLLAVSCLRAETFTNPRRLPTAGQPTSLLVGDLNGDGRPDVLYGSGAYGAVVLHPLLAQANGSYLPAADISLPAAIRQRCLLADLNADGTSDLICTGYSADYSTSEVAVLLGNGDATFQPAQISPLPANADALTATPAVAGDLNHDGHVDVLLTGVSHYNLLPLLGDGTGHFVAGPALSFGSLTVGVQLADLNGDDVPDIVVRDAPENSVGVFLGRGDGSFSDVVRYAQGRSAVLADVDGDGHPDLVAGSEGQIQLLHGNRDGSFGPTPLTTLTFSDGLNSKSGYGTVVTVLACLDLNGDGTPDILTGGDDGLTVLLGEGGLRFAAPVHYAVAQGFFLGPFMDSNAVVDLDGDGHVDFLSVGANGIYILYGKADGTFVSAPAYESGVVTTNATTADFNGDGNLDVVTTGDSDLHLRLGLGDGRFAPAVTIPGVAPPDDDRQVEVGPQVFHGDFNGDGKQDLLIPVMPLYSTRTDLSYLRFGRGDGSFSAPLFVSSFVEAPAFARVLAVRDMNHDGLEDVLSLDLNNLYVSLSKGDGSFRRVATPVPSGNVAVTIADFDHDGRLDVAYVDGSALVLLPGRGDGTFAAPVPVAPAPSMAGRSADVVSVTSADFDGDGNPDLAILVNYLSGPGMTSVCAPYLLFGDGHGGFSPAVAGPGLDTSYFRLYAADLDGDGRADLVASGPEYAYDPYTLAVMHTLPGRVLGSSTNYAAGTGFSYLAIADFNRDGRPDILALNGDSNQVSNSFTLLLNEPGPPEVTGTLVASPEPTAVSQAFTMTATLAFPDGLAKTLLNGSVSFSIDGSPLATAALVNNVATVSGPSTLPPGTHQISAVTSTLADATTSYAPVTLAGTHVVTGLPVNLSLTAEPNPARIAQSVTFHFAAVNGTGAPAGAAQPTGSITIAEGASTFATGSTTGDSGLSFDAGHSFLGAGTHTITATYSGDGLHAAASVSVTLLVEQIATTTAVSLSLNPSIYGQPVTLSAHVALVGDSGVTPSGTVLFTFCRGATLRATVDASGNASIRMPVPGAMAEAVGACSVVAAYSGDANLLASSSPVLPYTVTPANSASDLGGAPNPSYQGQTITFDAHISGIPGPTADPVTGLAIAPAGLLATGMVQLMEGGIVLGSAPIVSGHALIPISTLAVGNHALTAVYPGDGNLLASQSSVFQETVLPSAFTVSLSPSSLNVKGGTTAGLSVVVGSVGAFSGSLQLEVAGLPASMAAAFTPATLVVPPAGSAQATLAVSPTAVPYTVVGANGPRHSPDRTGFRQTSVLLAVFVLVPCLLRRRRGVPALLAMLLAAGAMGSSLGCSTLVERIAYPPPATSSLQVIVTDPRTGATQAATLTVTVVP